MHLRNTSKMSLFTVNRYTSGEGSARVQDIVDKSTEKKRLAELLTKVQKRKENLKLKRLKSSSKLSAKKEIKAKRTIASTKTNKVLEVVKNDNDENSSTITDETTLINSKVSKEVHVNKGMEMTVTEEKANEAFTVLVKDKFKKVKQAEIIPWLLQEYQNSLTGYWPRDLCVSAPTGSGKTLAFALPIIQILQSQRICAIRALVLLPTQTLARQVFQVFHEYCKGTILKVVLASGQMSLQKEQSHLVSHNSCGYHSLADILVTTPGRLVHHLRDTPGLSLQQLRFLVVDEADRVMDGTQSNWMLYLDNHLSSKSSTLVSHQPCQAPSLTLTNFRRFQPAPQKLLFSATITHDPEKLSELGLFQPKLFTFVVKNAFSTLEHGLEHMETKLSNQYTMPAEIQEFYTICEDEGAKPLLLYCLLVKSQKTLCFTSTKTAAHRLTLLLLELSFKSKQPLRVAEISAVLYLQERNKILSQFSKGEIDVIVSSDALARGIDIPQVDCVVSYDTPQLIQQYVHRMGRTGRAGRQGTAITILTPEQQSSFEHMLRSAGRLQSVQTLQPPLKQMEKLEDIYCSALTSVKKKIQEENSATLSVIKIKKSKKINSKLTVRHHYLRTKNKQPISKLRTFAKKKKKLKCRNVECSR